MVPDDLLIEVYLEVDIPADQLILDASAGERFLSTLAKRTTDPIEAQRTLARVVTLRKLGRLPRLRRRRSA